MPERLSNETFLPQPSTSFQDDASFEHGAGPQYPFRPAPTFFGRVKQAWTKNEFGFYSFEADTIRQLVPMAIGFSILSAGTRAMRLERRFMSKRIKRNPNLHSQEESLLKRTVVPAVQTLAQTSFCALSIGSLAAGFNHFNHYVLLPPVFGASVFLFRDGLGPIASAVRLNAAFLSATSLMVACLALDAFSYVRNGHIIDTDGFYKDMRQDYFSDNIKKVRDRIRMNQSYQKGQDSLGSSSTQSEGTPHHQIVDELSELDSEEQVLLRRLEKLKAEKQ